MTDTDAKHPGANPEQQEYWNGPGATRWAQNWPQIDAVLTPLHEALLERANPRPGELVIDLGCGHGTTTLALAERVTPSGHIHGVDISGVLLEIARARADEVNLSNVTLTEADATTYAFEAGRFDLVFSRFGLMFFEDPVASFSNLARVLKPAGRLVFLCWKAIDENGWVFEGLKATFKHLEPPAPAKPGAPGPFSLADPERIRSILTGAGFSNIALDPLTPTLRVAASPEDATEFFTKIGPGARLLADVDPEIIESIKSTMTERFRAHMSDDGVRLGAAAWLATATR